MKKIIVMSLFMISLNAYAKQNPKIITKFCAENVEVICKENIENEPSYSFDSCISQHALGLQLSFISIGIPLDGDLARVIAYFYCDSIITNDVSTNCIEE